MKTIKHLKPALTLFIFCACGSGSAEPTGNGGTDAQPSADAFVVTNSTVWVHTAKTLFRTNKVGQDLSRAAVFSSADEPQISITDIAVDSQGRMVGVSYSMILYDIDPESGNATAKSKLPRFYNGLAFIPASETSSATDDTLVAVSESGLVSRFLPSGAPIEVGSYGPGLLSSGDLVGISGLGIFATARKDGSEADVLVKLAPKNGWAAEVVGDIGFKDIWGLAYTNGALLGFTAGGETVAIDPSTGRGSLQEKTSDEWWGAAVGSTVVQ